VIHAALHALLVASALALPLDQPAQPRIIIGPGGKPEVAPTPAPMPPPKPAPLPTSVTIAGERFELLSLTGYEGQVTWDVSGPAAPVVVLFEKAAGSESTGWRVGATKPDRYPIGKLPTVEIWAIGIGEVTVSAWGVDKGSPVKLASFRVIVNTAPQPPPPEPKPPEPAPAKVTSFRVFLIYDPNATLTAEQYGVLYGVEVEKALQAACNIPSASAWRRLDKNTNPANISPTAAPGLKEAWTATKPAITTTPCIAFQVNEKITIEALPATPADAVALITKYREGK
jgi:hypothetical protein